MIYDLVMEGGGAKGIVFIGAMEAFLQRGHKSGRLLGTSAGAITATLVAAGYDAAEMRAALDEQVNGRSVLTTFMSTPGGFSDEEIAQSVTSTYLREIDIPLLPRSIEEQLERYLLNALLMHPGYRHLFSFVERGGWYSADNFVTWLARKLDSSSPNGQTRSYSGLTLQEFFDATGVHLSLIASDTTAHRMLVLNHITAPDLPVVWATRMSMSIPIVWQEVVWKADWGHYQGKPIAGNCIVDGGLLSNFPIELFISTLAHVTAVMGPKVDNNILGFLIDEEAAVPDAPPADGAAAPPDLRGVRTIQRARSLLDTLMVAHDKMVIDAFSHLVVRMPAKDYGIIEFDMNDARRDALIAAGRNAMAAYLDQPSPAMIPLPAAAQQQIQATADRIAGRILAR